MICAEVLSNAHLNRDTVRSRSDWGILKKVIAIYTKTKSIRISDEIDCF